jgi:hypothetical protein
LDPAAAADQDLAALYNELRIKHEGLARYIRTLLARVKEGEAEK